MRRRLWIFAMVLALVFTCCGLSFKYSVAIAADESGEELTTTDGRYKYRIIDAENDEVEIVRAVQKQENIWSMQDGNAVLEIPSILENKYRVVKLGDNAFEGLISVSGTWSDYKHVENTIIIPQTVREIGESCFYGCTDTTDFVIPSSVTAFGGKAFLFTAWLDKERQTRTDHLVIVNNILIDGLKATGDIRVPGWVKEIAPNAFFGPNAQTDRFASYIGTDITSIVIPAAVKKIDEFSFCKNYSLARVELSSGLTEIGRQAFYGCKNISDIDIPATVKKLGAGAFYNCIRITAVTLSDSLEVFGKNVFGKDSEFNTKIVVTVSEGITNVDGWNTEQEEEVTFHVLKDSVVENFMKTNGLHYTTYNSSKTEPDPEPDPEPKPTPKPTPTPTPVKNNVKVGTGFKSGKLYYVVTSGSTVRVRKPNKKTYSAISIPAAVKYRNKSYKVTAIQSKAFVGCKKLSRLAIGNNVKIIGASAFSGCRSLTNINIGTGLENISRRAFYGAKSLKYITIRSRRLKSVGAQAFAGTTVNIKVRYPAGLEKKYASKTHIVAKGTVFVSGGLRYVVSSASTVKVREPVKRNCEYADIPNTVKYNGKTLKVTEICANAFKNCTKLRMVQISDNVKKIGDCSFKGCKALVIVEIGKSNSSQLTTIGKEAFSGVFVGDKEKVIINLRTKKLTRVGNWAFKGARNYNMDIKIPTTYTGKYDKLIQNPNVMG